MPFIEFKDIENFYGQDSETWKDILLSLGGVFVGFGLSEFATYLRNNRQKNRIGKSFKNEIDSLKPALEMQIKFNKTVYINENAKYNFIPPTAFIYKNLDYLKSLDRLQVSQYSKKQFGENYLKKVRIIYNQVTVIETEMERLLRFHETFMEELTSLYSLYREISNTYSRAIAEYFMITKLKTGDDKFIDDVMALTNDTLFKQHGTDNIVQFKNSLHLKLIEIQFNNNEHPMYKTVSNYNQKALDIITTITIKTESLIKKVNTVTVSLEKAYEKIYDEIVPENV